MGRDNCGIRISDCGLRISSPAAIGLSLRGSDAATRNPQSEILSRPACQKSFLRVPSPHEALDVPSLTTESISGFAASVSHGETGVVFRQPPTLVAVPGRSTRLLW